MYYYYVAMNVSEISLRKCFGLRLRYLFQIFAPKSALCQTEQKSQFQSTYLMGLFGFYFTGRNHNLKLKAFNVLSDYKYSSGSSVRFLSFNTYSYLPFGYSRQLTNKTKFGSSKIDVFVMSIHRGS